MNNSIDMDLQTQLDLLDYLSGFITENKKTKFEKVLDFRTHHIAVVLENIYQAHNASAVIRSCDLFGVQNLFVIENTNRYTLNPGVSVGASKWVDLKRYNKREADNTTRCLNDLRKKGYRIVATTPHRNDVTIDELPIDKPFALVYGTEETGLSPVALDMADEYVQIPQVGFTESFNISVSVALSLYEVTKRLWKSNADWKLSEQERLNIKLNWMRRVLARHKGLEERFFENRQAAENI